MTSEEILLVQGSWLQAEPMKEAIAEVFFLKLFELDPGMYTLLGDEEPARLRSRFLQMVTASVRGLDHMDALVPVLRELGVRHLIQGVRDEHYATVAAALLWTLEKALRSEFTPQVKAAWIKTYGVLSQTLRPTGMTSQAA
jgi:hemoglobin-like flavoprotein